MTIAGLLDACQIAHYPMDGDETRRKFVCPKCGGAADLGPALDDSGQVCLTCIGCKKGGVLRFDPDDFLRSYGNGLRSTEAMLAAAPPAIESFEHSDAGNAELLADRFGDFLRYVHGPEEWRVWRGGRWGPDVDGAVTRFVLAAAKDRLLRAAEIPDSKIAGEEAKWGIGSRSAKRVRDTLTIAGSIPPFRSTASQYDGDPWALNVENGTLDLEAGTLHEHNPAEMHSKLAAVSFDATEKCPRWDRFLLEVFDGDADLSDYFRRLAGLLLTADRTDQSFDIFAGGGANGKSTALNAIMGMSGDYAGTLDFSSLSYMRERQAGVRDDLAALPGKRLVSAVEASVGTRFAEGLLKQLTGNDPVTCRSLYGRPFTFKPVFRLLLAVNHKPTVKDTSLAFWRRVHLIPFTVQFRDEHADPRLGEKLAAERSGILNWALRGLDEWRQGGLDPPAAVRMATDDYKASEDVIGTFLAERTERDNAAVLESRDLRAAYQSWCERNGERIISVRAFGEAVAERGITKERAPTGRVRYVGLRLES